VTAAEQALTDHLAEKVCGWTKIDDNPPTWSMPPGTLCRQHFDPLHDPRDTSIVMEAWRKQDGTIDLHVGDDGNMAAAESKENHSGSCFLDVPWTEAVCGAIGKASGWKGGE